MLDRRQLLSSLATTGIGTSLFHRALAAQDNLDTEAIKRAEWITELELTEQQRQEILRTVNRSRAQLAELRQTKLTADVPMAIHFRPAAEQKQQDYLVRDARPIDSVVVDLPDRDEDIAFLPVSQLSWLVRTQRLTSVRLTKIYLERLKRYGDLLHCVVTLTEALAMRQAKQADQEIQAGYYRGPLHGIPWGAKDLIAVPGYPTTWGIPYHKQQELPYKATVAERLENAGAVLLGKLSLGALAQGDKWFGGMTRSPWNPKIGSSGSSAGSASATVAGLVAFSLGSETLGSILSPSIRCGASSLRPTFGRVSRHGCMPLSWSLDKIGPICRSMEDCALVFDAIHGADNNDPTAGNYGFQWPYEVSFRNLKVGYRKSARTPDDQREDLKLLQNLGCQLVEIELPSKLPLSALTKIIGIEAASVFDDLLRQGQTEGWNTWDESFRAAQYVSAVDYVRIQRTRTLLIQEFAKAVQGVDCWVNMNDLLHTNFTGHPSAVFPVGYREEKRNGQTTPRPRPMVISGHLNADDQLLALAHACQRQLDAHQTHPKLDAWVAKEDD